MKSNKSGIFDTQTKNPPPIKVKFKRLNTDCNSETPLYFLVPRDYDISFRDSAILILLKLDVETITSVAQCYDILGFIMTNNP